MSYGSSANDTNLTTGDSVTPLRAFSERPPTISPSSPMRTGPRRPHPIKRSSCPRRVPRGRAGSFGVANQYGLSSPSSFPATPATPTTTSLLAELNNLEAELASLEAQAAKVHQSGSNTTAGGGSSQLAAKVHQSGSNTTAGGGSSQFTFTALWSAGNDVKELQDFLISQNSGPAARKLKAHGTTNTFGTLTLNALIEFRRKKGSNPPQGTFGPVTRGVANDGTWR